VVKVKTTVDPLTTRLWTLVAYPFVVTENWLGRGGESEEIVSPKVSVRVLPSEVLVSAVEEGDVWSTDEVLTKFLL
jgi:hypothetical protein